jgi:hypothetical protein
LFPDEKRIDLRDRIAMLPMFKRVTASTGIVLRQDFYNDIKVVASLQRSFAPLCSPHFLYRTGG